MSASATDYRLDWILREGDTIQTADATYIITGEPIGLGGSSVLYPASKSGSHLDYAIKECFPREPSAYKRDGGVVSTADPNDEINRKKLDEFRRMISTESELGQEIRNTTIRAVSAWDVLIPVSITTGGEVFFEVLEGTFSVLERMDKKGRFFNELLGDIRNACPPQERRITFGLPTIHLTVQIMEQALRALKQVHDAGYYFGDLSGANLLLTECDLQKGHVGIGHLIDFGSTRKVEADGYTAPIINEPVFSTDGFKPFEIRDHREGVLRLGKQADIYSAGCLFLHCVLSPAKIKTLGDSPSAGSNILTEANGKAIGCSGSALQLINEILDKATQYDPEDRYTDASEMLDAVLELKKFVEPPKFLLPSNLSSPDYWVPHSRDKELAILEKAVNDGETVFIHGVGGIGKTECAIQLAKRLDPPRGAYLIHFQTSMRDTIMHLNFSGYKFRSSSNTSKEMLEEMEYQDRLRILKDYYQDAVIVVDNFNVDDKTLDDLQQESAYRDVTSLSSISFIFTTRYEIIAHPEWELKSLGDEAALQILKTYCPQVSDLLLKRIITAVHSHTLALTLIGKGIRESQGRMTAAQVIEALDRNTLSQVNSPVISSDKDREYRQADIYAHLRILFNLSALSTMQKSAMIFAAFLTGEGLPCKRLLHMLWEQTRPVSFESYEENEQHQQKCADVIQVLTKCGWLKSSPENIITIHPVIQEIVIEELNPCMGNCERGLTRLQRVQFHGVGMKVLPDSFQLASYFTRAGRILNAEWLARSGQEIYAELAKQDAILKPHIKALSVAQKRGDVNCSGLAEKYEQIGLAHISLDGHGKQAVDNCLEALRLRENDPKTTNEQLAWSLFYVGMAYQRHHGEQGHFAGITDSLMLAEDYHRRALAIWNELPPLRVNSYNIAQDKSHFEFITAYNQMLSDYGYRWFPGDFAQDDKILYWLQIEASLEDVTAMLSLARRYRDGIGCYKDLKLSYYWASMAVAVQTKHDSLMLPNSGHTEVDHYIKNCVTTYGYYKKPLINGARVFFASQIINGIYYAPSEEEKTYWTWYAAEAGDLRYMVRYAKCLLNGAGCREDRSEAFALLCRIAKTIGTSNSEELTYHHGDLWPRDLEDVKNENQQILEKVYQIVLQNYDESHIQEWHRCAAKAGNLKYVDGLGKYLLSNATCTEDYRDAYELLIELSGKGSVMADYYLGWMYINGVADGNTKDIDRGISLYSSAALDGCEEAGLALAKIYFGLDAQTVQVVPQDPCNALFFCDFVACNRRYDAGDEQIYEVLDILQMIEEWEKTSSHIDWSSDIYFALYSFYIEHAFETHRNQAELYLTKSKELKAAEPEKITAQTEDETDEEIAQLAEDIIRELEEYLNSH